MFIVDVSPTMGTKRTLDLPPGPNGETRTKEATHLQWSLQFAMLKIQEMVCIVSCRLSLPDWVSI
jgi:ATP-dependent DNA helicase 2 subunit 2